MWADMCTISSTSSSPSGGGGGGGGGGSLPVTELFSQLFSTEASALSVMFSVSVGSLLTRSQFMSTTSDNTQVKFC